MVDLEKNLKKEPLDKPVSYFSDKKAYHEFRSSLNKDIYQEMKMILYMKAVSFSRACSKMFG